MVKKNKIKKSISLIFGITLSLIGIGTLTPNILNNTIENFWFFILSSFLIGIGLVLVKWGFEDDLK